MSWRDASWQPTASLPALQQRAMLYQRIRQFFLERNLLEVDVPVLSEYATVDPFIESIRCDVMGKPHYLQTSPEFFLKRLLAAYQHDVYYLGKAFRQDERGRRHRPEFTLLEWYRVGFNEQQLIVEVNQLLRMFFPEKPLAHYRYRDIFYQTLSIDPHTATAAELAACADLMIGGEIDQSLRGSDKNTYLDLLFTHCIEPALPLGIVVIDDYPATQAALARVTNDSQGQAVAKRFEIYIDKIELANGYWELSNGVEQQTRFQQDLAYRQQHQLSMLPYDQRLVDALSEGNMPDCAGVALGIDRLLMCWLEVHDISDVVSF